MEKFYPVFLREKDIDALRSLLVCEGRFEELVVLVPGLLPALADPLPKTAADVVLGGAPVIASTVLAVEYGGHVMDVYVTSMFKDGKLSLVMEMPRNAGGPSLAITVERVFATWLGRVLREIRGVGNARGELWEIAEACHHRLTTEVAPTNLDEAVAIFNLQDWVEIFCAPNLRDYFSGWTRYSVDTYAFHSLHCRTAAAIREAYGNLVFDASDSYARQQNKLRKGGLA